MTKQNQIAWSAGLFEGEGSIVLTQHWGGGWDRNGVKSRVRLQMEMTDTDVIERFRDVVGFGSLCFIKANGNRKAKLKWFGSGTRAVELLQKWIPFLGERRKHRAREAIAAHKDYVKLGGRRGELHSYRHRYDWPQSENQKTASSNFFKKRFS